MKEMKRLYAYVTRRPDGELRLAACGDETNTIPLLSTRPEQIAHMKEIVAEMRKDGVDVQLYEFSACALADEAAVVAEGESLLPPEPEAPANHGPVYWAGQTAEA